ncbi:hypothetical protein AB4Y83_21745 [Terrabacter sp. RAF57]
MALLLVAAGIVVALSRADDSRSSPPETAASPKAQTSATPTLSDRGSPNADRDPLASELDRLRGAVPVAPGPLGLRIAGEASQQPDLYAAEFVRRLLTQDYRTPRAEHLAWVQSESAQTSEPLVVGLVPKELRGQLAVHSVTDAVGQASAVPSEHVWTGLGLQDAFTTVQIDGVEEPMAWSTAVSSGRISDPGITGRQVSATVNLHYIKGGRRVSSTSSVAMTLNLQGPPTRASWGFVTAVTYSSLAAGAS